MGLPDAASWSLFLLFAFGAEVIGTVAGFGAATILTPVAVLFLDVKTAIATVAVFHLFGNASRLYFFGRQIHWPTWRLFGVTGVLFSLLGASVTTTLPASVMKLCLGVFLVAYVAASAAAPKSLRLPQTPLLLLGGGAVSGFIAGLIGTGGAIRSACLLAFGLPTETYLATSAAIALMVDATRLPVYLVGGFIPSALLPLLGALLVVAFAGSWTGQRMVHRMSAAWFRRVVWTMLSVIGAKLLADGWRGV